MRRKTRPADRHRRTGRDLVLEYRRGIELGRVETVVSHYFCTILDDLRIPHIALNARPAPFPRGIAQGYLYHDASAQLDHSHEHKGEDGSDKSELGDRSSASFLAAGRVGDSVMEQLHS